MGKGAGGITVILLLALVIGLALGNSGNRFLVAAAPPNSPYTGTGGALDVYEFARNDSASFADATKDSAFSYLGSWYPTGYRGYHLRTEVSNLRKVVDPVPNGDIDHYDEPGNNWTLTQRNPGPPYLISSIDNATGGNPGHCLNATLTNGKPGTGVRTSYIYNNFTYVSAFTPTSLTLSFDIRYSADVTNVSWLVVEVAIFGSASRWSWSRAISAYSPTSWSHNSFSTGPVNGPVSLRIAVNKTNTGNPTVSGSIAFDNFQYNIVSAAVPSEVQLALNGTALVNTGSSNGSLDFYADPALRDAVSLTSCWSTTRLYQFSANCTIIYNYAYSMCVKAENLGGAQAFFVAPADDTPSWVANYTIPGNRPPPGYVNYSFGLFVPAEWTFSSVKDGQGNDYAYTYNTTTRLVRLADIIAPSGKTFSIHASTPNHVLAVHAQRGPTSSGPWVNMTGTDSITAGEYLRALAELLPIGTTGNLGSVSVFLPNGTLWRSDATPTFDADHETLTSAAWALTVVTEGIAGSGWLITVSFNNARQCGMRTQAFATYIEPNGALLSPSPGSRHLWGSTVFVNATWQNNASLTYVTGADVQVRYVDRNSQVQFATMSSNGQGAYSTYIATNLLRPNRTAELDIEFRKLGYLNATYSQGTHLPVVFNLVNDLNYQMVRPVQSTGPDEYTGQTSVSVGYTTQVRLYDLFEVQYARNDTAPWSGAVRVNCSRYEDTGSGWAFAGTGTFLPNGGDATLFQKADANYSASLQRVRYSATARFVGGPWDYQQQNFTVIIEMVAFASNLTALRTLVLHPPSGAGDGWTLFNPAFDDYEVHLYADEVLNITVYYENVSALPFLPISDASANLIVLGSSFSVPNRGNGFYGYTLDTASLGIGSIQLEVNASRADCAAQTIIIHLLIERRPCQLKPTSLVIDVTWGDTFWVVTYFNDTVDNQPITGAPIQYYWGPLSGSMTATGVPGWYNVSLPTVTHTTGSRPLNLTVSFDGYETAALVLSVNIKQRPTEMGVDSVQAYFPGANLTTTLSGTTFSVPVSDIFMIRLTFADANGTLIDDATGLLSWSRGSVYLVYMDGFYVLQLNLTAVPPGSYVCQIQLSRQNYAPQLLTFQLNIMLIPTEISGINNTIAKFAGQPFGITLFFRDTYHDVGIVGASVTIAMPSLGVSALQLTDLGNGSYTLADLLYSVEGIFDIQITAQAGPLYAVVHRQVSLVLRASGGGSQLVNLAILAIAVVAIALLLGFVAYSKVLRPRVVAPRHLAHAKKLQDVADMFNDVNNLSRFLVLHRGSGIAIFDPFSEQGMDGALFGGFLQAISAFAVDVARTGKDDDLPTASQLHEISYEGFRILLHDGSSVRTALVFKGQPSENLKKKMEEFTTRFEAKYAKELGEWCCEPEAFQDATGLLEDIFHVSLLLPHKVQPKLPETKPLTDLESKLYGIALALTHRRDAILLQKIIQAYTTAIKADRLEVLSALYQLREKKLLVPIEFYRLTQKAREQLATEPKPPRKSSSP